MKYVASDYQIRAKDFIMNRLAASLWLEMGLGKTAITLDAIVDLYASCELDNVLVLAPVRVAKSTWPAEVEKWDHTKHLDYAVACGKPDERAAAIARDVPLTFMNYENLQWLERHVGRRWKWDMVIADESTLLKSFRLRNGSKRALALSHSRKRVNRWVNLTGSPAPNGLLDLWGQQWFIDGGRRLGRTYTAFKDRWFRPAYNGYGVEPLAHADGEIHGLLKDVCLSMKTADYLQLPDRVDNYIYVDIPTAAQRHYDRMQSEFFAELATGQIEASTAAIRSQKLSQIASGAVYLTDEDGRATREVEHIHDVKLHALDEIIEEAAGAPVLIGYWYGFDRDRILKRYKNAVVLDKDPATIDRWNRGEIPILLAHPQSAGHGLNLQAGGNILAWFGPIWSLEYYSQFVARLHRRGQAKPVFNHIIVARNTIDEIVIDAIQHKRTVQNALMHAVRDRGY